MYRMTSATAARALTVLLLIGAVACGKKDDATVVDTGAAITPAPAALRVAEIDVGKGLNADKTVRDETDNFGVRDTIYASVRTEGTSASAAKLAAKWTFQDGQTVNESSLDIAPNTSEARHEFHIQKATAWPAGNYKVEVTLDGTPVGSKDFTIR